MLLMAYLGHYNYLSVKKLSTCLSLITDFFLVQLRCFYSITVLLKIGYIIEQNVQEKKLYVWPKNPQSDTYNDNCTILLLSGYLSRSFSAKSKVPLKNPFIEIWGPKIRCCHFQAFLRKPKKWWIIVQLKDTQRGRKRFLEFNCAKIWYFCFFILFFYLIKAINLLLDWLAAFSKYIIFFIKMILLANVLFHQIWFEASVLFWHLKFKTF